MILLRTFYALCTNFNEINTHYLQDYSQIYLMGLKYYTSGIWPYWGPDITYTSSQIPGALQGLLTGIPFYIWNAPESPILFLNILTGFSLLFLGWYLSKRISNVPKWFIFSWLFLAPWTLNFSTTTINPSYVFAPAVLFFIGIIDVLPLYKKALLPKWLTHLIIGLAIGWIMQLHMSWVLLPFYVLAYGLWLLFRRRFRDVGMAVLSIGSGFIIGISTLIPTIAKYPDVLLNAESVVVFNPSNFKNIDMISRFLSFTSAEILTFAEGMDGFRYLLEEHPWSTPFLMFLLVIGYVQITYFIWNFVRPGQKPEFQKVRAFAMCTMLLLYVAYLFAVREVANYTIYVVAPAALIYGIHSLESIFHKRWVKVTGVILLVSSAIFHVVMGLFHFENRSLYSKIDLIEDAIASKDSRKFAYRRVADWERNYRQNAWAAYEMEDGRVRFENEFTGYDPEIRPETLVESSRHPGSYSLVVDSLFPFGETLEIDPQVLGSHRKISVGSLSFLPPEKEGFICVVWSEGDSTIQWNAYPVKNEEAPYDNVISRIFVDSLATNLTMENFRLSVYPWFPNAEKGEFWEIKSMAVIIE